MGMSASGILAYGYNLGSDETEWEVQQVDEYGGLALDWFSSDDFDPDSGEDDFTVAAMKRLLAAAGFAETDWRADGYVDRKREAEARVGVEFELYCSAEYSEYILATKVITVQQGHIKTLDITSLLAEPVENRWDETLNAALATLGLTPKQEKPGWLLCSYLG